jgi:hypothetical protein
MKHSFSLLYVIGVIVAIIVYIVALYPFLQNVIDELIPSLSQTEIVFLTFLPLIILIMLLVHLFRNPSGNQTFH